MWTEYHTFIVFPHENGRWGSGDWGVRPTLHIATRCHHLSLPLICQLFTTFEWISSNNWIIQSGQCWNCSICRMQRFCINTMTLDNIVFQSCQCAQPVPSHFRHGHIGSEGSLLPRPPHLPGSPHPHHWLHSQNNIMCLWKVSYSCKKIERIT